MPAERSRTTPPDVPLADLLALRPQWQAAGATVVWTNGCFDLLHAGHAEFLTEARQLGDLLVVGLNSDESVRRLKGPTRPLMDFGSRATLLRALRAVDHVVCMAEDTPCHEIELLRPDICCKDEEYAEKPLPERELVESYGGQMRLLARRPGYSTTALAARIAAATAAA